jgi:hypothetical protein
LKEFTKLMRLLILLDGVSLFSSQSQERYASL